MAVQSIYRQSWDKKPKNKNQESLLNTKFKMILSQGDLDPYK